MKTLVGGLIALLIPVLAFAQPRADASLRITVVDPSGAVIVGAQTTLTPAGAGAAAAAALETGARGEALVTALEPGRYTIRVESPGFEPSELRDVRLKAGENRREVR